MRTIQTSIAASAVLCFVAGAVTGAGTANASERKKVTAFYVTIIDHGAGGKRSRLKIDPSRPTSSNIVPRGPIIASQGGTDSCSVTTTFHIDPGFAITCDSESPESPSRANAWGDCTVNDEKHPLGFQFIAKRSGGPNWELWAWCSME